MVGLPRHIIKKYGVSKKAWAVFRGGSSHKKRAVHHKKRRVASHAGGYVGRRKKGGFRRGSDKPNGALVNIGKLATALCVGYTVSDIANKSVGARGVIKHATGFATGGPVGALGSGVNDFVSGRGIDLSFQMPGTSSTSRTSGGTTF